MYLEYPLRTADRRNSGYGQEAVLDEEDIMCATRTAACVLFTGARNARAAAESIHRHSGWGWGPFTVIDCGASEAALDRDLFAPLESDLWPVNRSVPVLRLLQPGTLFLEEVGRLGHRPQSQLRDLLELAANETAGRRSRRRIMASTSEPLLTRVSEGAFDETLFYRLNAMHFVL